MVLDRDIGDGVWNGYLKKYGDRFRLFCNGDGVWSIRCRFGLVEPFSVVKKELVGSFEFVSSMKLTYFLKKLDNIEGFGFRISQRGDVDVCIVFDEGMLESVASYLGVYRRRVLSDVERQRRRDLMLKIRAGR